MNFTYFLPGGVAVLHIVIGGHYFTFLFVNDRCHLQTEKREFKGFESWQESITSV